MAAPLTAIEIQMRAMIEHIAAFNRAETPADAEKAAKALKKAERVQVMHMAKLDRLIRDKPDRLEPFHLDAFDATRRELDAAFAAFMAKIGTPHNSTARKVFKRLREIAKDIAVDLFPAMDEQLRETTTRLQALTEQNAELNKRIRIFDDE